MQGVSGVGQPGGLHGVRGRVGLHGGMDSMLRLHIYVG